MKTNNPDQIAIYNIYYKIRYPSYTELYPNSGLKGDYRLDYPAGEDGIGFSIDIQDVALDCTNTEQPIDLRCPPPVDYDIYYDGS